MRLLLACIAASLAACTGLPPAHDAARSEVLLTPDNPDNPRSVRFDVPTALVMDLPGGRVPETLQARISTREIAARELAAAGYCRNGFTGPEGVFFPDADRSRSAFIVRCIV